MCILLIFIMYLLRRVMRDGPAAMNDARNQWLARRRISGISCGVAGGVAASDLSLCFQSLLQLGGRHRSAVEVALQLGAADMAQEIGLLLRFHAFGHH